MRKRWSGLDSRFDVNDCASAHPFGILQSMQDAGRAVTMQSSSEEKIRLFRAMFCGREDVFISTAYYKIGGGWKYRKARPLTRPPWRFRSTDLDDSVYRLGVPRSTDLGFSVDRPGDFGGPTAALRSTDMANSVYRLCLPPGEPSIPAKGRVNTSVWSLQ